MFVGGQVVDGSSDKFIIFFHSSEDEGCTVSSGTRGKRDAHLSSEDEFEKEMNSEAMVTLQLMLSPTAAAQAAKGHVTRATPTTSDGATNKPQTGKTNRARARARQRRSSADQRKKMVRFSGDVKTDDVMEEGASAGLLSDINISFNDKLTTVNMYGSHVHVTIKIDHLLF